MYCISHIYSYSSSINRAGTLSHFTQLTEIKCLVLASLAFMANVIQFNVNYNGALETVLSSVLSTISISLISALTHSSSLYPKTKSSTVCNVSMHNEKLQFSSLGKQYESQDRHGEIK